MFSSSDFESEKSASGEDDLDRGEIHVSLESLLADSERVFVREFLNMGDRSFGCKCNLLTRLLVSVEKNKKKTLLEISDDVNLFYLLYYQVNVVFISSDQEKITNTNIDKTEYSK